MDLKLNSEMNRAQLNGAYRILKIRCEQNLNSIAEQHSVVQLRILATILIDKITSNFDVPLRVLEIAGNPSLDKGMQLNSSQIGELFADVASLLEIFNASVGLASGEPRVFEPKTSDKSPIITNMISSAHPKEIVVTESNDVIATQTQRLGRTVYTGTKNAPVPVIRTNTKLLHDKKGCPLKKMDKNHWPKHIYRTDATGNFYKDNVVTEDEPDLYVVAGIKFTKIGYPDAWTIIKTSQVNNLSSVVIKDEEFCSSVLVTEQLKGYRRSKTIIPISYFEKVGNCETFVLMCKNFDRHSCPLGRWVRHVHCWKHLDQEVLDWWLNDMLEANVPRCKTKWPFNHTIWQFSPTLEIPDSYEIERRVKKFIVWENEKHQGIFNYEQKQEPQPRPLNGKVLKAAIHSAIAEKKKLLVESKQKKLQDEMQKRQEMKRKSITEAPDRSNSTDAKIPRVSHSLPPYTTTTPSWPRNRQLFACSEEACEYTSFSEEEFGRHTACHLLKYPWACLVENCVRTYSTKKNRDGHLRDQHGLKVFHCQHPRLCKAVFITASAKRAHDETCTA